MLPKGGNEAAKVGEVSRRVKISSQVDVRSVDELTPSKQKKVRHSARMRSTPQKRGEDYV